MTSLVWIMLLVCLLWVGVYEPVIQHSPQEAQLLLCEARGGGLPGEEATRLG